LCRFLKINGNGKVFIGGRVFREREKWVAAPVMKTLEREKLGGAEWVIGDLN
jgi:hypothetical protein